VTPHVTQNNAVTKTGKIRNSAIDERTTRHRRSTRSSNIAARFASKVADGPTAISV
jgi:hypothetical protein